MCVVIVWDSSFDCPALAYWTVIYVQGLLRRFRELHCEVEIGVHSKQYTKTTVSRPQLHFFRVPQQGRTDLLFALIMWK
jgi:hypothetical protein